MGDQAHRDSGAPRSARTNDSMTGAHLSVTVDASKTGRPAASQGTRGSVQRSLVGERSVAVGIPRGLPAATEGDVGGPSKRARKERGPNWSGQEIYELIAAKRKLFLLESERRDERELIMTEAVKWQRISDAITAARVSSFPRDASACKSKWNQVLPEYKRIADYFTRSGRNEVSYWTMSSSARKKEGLPKTFPHDVFYQIREWYGKEPAVLPPHSRDFLSPEDITLGTTEEATPEVPVDGSHEVSVDIDASEAAGTDSMTESTESPTCIGGGRGGPLSRPRKHRSKSASPMPRFKRTIPAGIKPQLLSSSDTAETGAPKRPPSTAVRRKSLSGHSLIAEVTKATGTTMANEIRDMALCGRELEQSKINLQERIFKQQMEYQKERETRSQENARIRNEHSKLSLDRQSEMVSSLANISAVLKATLLNRGVGSGGADCVLQADTVVGAPAVNANAAVHDGGGGGVGSIPRDSDSRSPQ